MGAYSRGALIKISSPEVALNRGGALNRCITVMIFNPINIIYVELSFALLYRVYFIKINTLRSSEIFRVCYSTLLTGLFWSA